MNERDPYPRKAQEESTKNSSLFPCKEKNLVQYHGLIQPLAAPSPARIHFVLSTQRNACVQNQTQGKAQA